MTFQPAVPVEKVLKEIHKRAYVLPAIQREFVWNTAQILMLFDSLLRGYPIGSFLFWTVEANRAREFTFYDFIRNYHEKDAPYAPAITIPSGQGVVAILDGQQRLTALNIGLHGSHAERQPRKWANNPDAYPKKRLYLDLLGEGPDEELGMKYDFRFLTEAEGDTETDGVRRWYRVGDVLGLENSGPAIMAELDDRGLQGAQPFQWQELDAREEARSLLSTLNTGSTSFSFSKDVVLKAGLTLIDAPDIRFKVSNFTQQNMSLLEKKWSEVRVALIVARDLLESFGFSERTLSSDSVIVPLAYYAYARGLGSNYVTSSNQAADRQAMRSWVMRSQMKRGIWGSGLDTLLSRLRDVLREHGSMSFPADELEAAMARMGKSLRFDDAEIEELCELSYGRPRTFATLAMLYPGLDLTKQFHEDHIFPKSRFTRARLLKAEIPAESVDSYLDRPNNLPNLQLLAGVPNTEKQAKLPLDWLQGPHFTSTNARETYMRENDLDGLSLEFERFLEFYDGRRGRIESRLRALLDAAPGQEPPARLG